MPDQEPPKRTVQMYDRPASADSPAAGPGRLILIAFALIIFALLIAKFVFHIHFGHLLHAGH
jgi:hypothetical protein